MSDSYQEFVEAKVSFDQTFGFDVADVDLHQVLKPHQRDIVRWAVRGGRRAIFAAFGMGKPKGKKGSAWAEREESTWIDQL